MRLTRQAMLVAALATAAVLVALAVYRPPKLSGRTLLLAGLVTGVAALVALVMWFMRRRGKEGITWENRDSEVKDDNHKRQISQWCASGKKVSAILDKYPHLSRYTFAAVMKECDDNAEAWITYTKKQKGAVDTSSCGGKVCGDAALRVTHPCTNKDGSKCCVPKNSDGGYASVPGLQNCITPEGAISEDAVKRVATEVVVMNGCLYDSRQKKNNKWACQPGWIDTGITWHVGKNNRQVSADLARQQCAKTEECKQKAAKAFDMAKKVVDIDWTAGGTGASLFGKTGGSVAPSIPSTPGPAAATRSNATATMYEKDNKGGMKNAVDLGSLGVGQTMDVTIPGWLKGLTSIEVPDGYQYKLCDATYGCMKEWKTGTDNNVGLFANTKYNPVNFTGNTRYVWNDQAESVQFKRFR